jgi:hypothetical protein
MQMKGFIMQIALPFALVSLLASLIYLVIFFALHILPTGYHPVRNAVSDYAVGNFGPLFRVALWSSSIGVVTLAIGLATGVGMPPLAERDIIFLVLIAVARVAMSLFPTDIEGKRLTFIGLLHYVFAILAFTFTYMAISHFTPVLQTLNPWQQAKEPLGWLAQFVTPALVLVVITMFRPLRRFFGLFERLFLLSTNIWFLLVSLFLLMKVF